MQPARSLATDADLLALPGDVKAEILAGSLEVLPAPMPRHARVQSGLARLVGGPFDDDDGRGGPGGWWIFLEVDVELGPHDVVRPDASGWRRERLADPDVRPVAVVPDWVCEIVSPSTEARDRSTKKRLYAERGVSFYWLIDPEARTLEAYALHDGRWVDVGSHDDTETARLPPFEAVELPVGRLFLPKRA